MASAGRCGMQTARGMVARGTRRERIAHRPVTSQPGEVPLGGLPSCRDDNGAAGILSIRRTTHFPAEEGGIFQGVWPLPDRPAAASRTGRSLAVERQDAAAQRETDQLRLAVQA